MPPSFAKTFSSLPFFSFKACFSPFLILSYFLFLSLYTHLPFMTRSVQAVLDPYDRSKDIRPEILQNIDNGRKNWGTDLAVGLGSTRGNVQVNTINLEGDGFKRIEDYAGYLLGNIYYMDYNGLRIRDQGLLMGRGDYKATENLRFFFVSTHAYNQYSHLNYRGSLGAGPRYRIETTSILTGTTGVSLAPTYEAEFYYDGQVRRTLRLALRYLGQFKATENTSIGFDFMYMPWIKNFGNYRFYSLTYLENALYEKTLKLRIAYSLEYYSNPPSEILKSDSTFSTSFVLHLGE